MNKSTIGLDDALTSWFVVWTKSRAEKKVEARLSALGLSSWLPTVIEVRRWSDRSKETVCPLFPGYLFARGPAVEWHKVLRTQGVLTVVKEHGEPAFVSPEIVAQLKDVIQRRGVAPEPVSGLHYSVGDEVIVQDGPLRGVRGIVRENRNRRQLVIWIAQIGRGVALTIGSALVAATVTNATNAPAHL